MRGYDDVGILFNMKIGDPIIILDDHECYYRHEITATKMNEWK